MERQTKDLKRQLQRVQKDATAATEMHNMQIGSLRSEFAAQDKGRCITTWTRSDGSVMVWNILYTRRFQTALNGDLVPDSQKIGDLGKIGDLNTESGTLAESEFLDHQGSPGASCPTFL